MSDYYVVSKQAIDATADAIKAMNGSSSDIEWGQDGFASEIGNQRKFSHNDIARRNYSGDIVLTGNFTMAQYAFAGSGITSITGLDLTTAGVGSQYTFQGCKSLVTVNLPKWAATGSNVQYTFDGCSALKNVTLLKMTSTYNYAFRNCTSLEKIALPSWAGGNTGGFNGCSKLTHVDLSDYSNTTGSLVSAFFQNCAILSVIVLRPNRVVSLSNVNVFDGTPFASGGAGGTIYIPESMYNKLGTGTGDYEAATNWATIDGYGTITWAKIEGSQYENYYADGTPIPT